MSEEEKDEQREQAKSESGHSEEGREDEDKKENSHPENGSSSRESEEENLPSQTDEDEPMFVEIPVDRYKNLQDRARERDEYLDKLRRVSADYDNYQKRMRKKRKEDKKYAARDVIAQIVPVLDDFDQAIPDEESDEESDLVQGMRMIYKKLLSALEDAGVEQIDEENVRFDPNRHEAATSLETEHVEKDSVEKILRKGYQLHDQVLRPARVVVAKPPNDDSDSE